MAQSFTHTTPRCEEDINTVGGWRQSRPMKKSREITPRFILGFLVYATSCHRVVYVVLCCTWCTRWYNYSLWFHRSFGGNQRGQRAWLQASKASGVPRGGRGGGYAQKSREKIQPLSFFFAPPSLSSSLTQGRVCHP